MKLWIAVGLALAMAGPAHAFKIAAFSAEFRKAVPTAAAKTRDAFDRRLADYPSARFREVRAVRADANPAPNIRFCGLVNAKNRMGAYGGWERFVAVQGYLKFDGDGSADLEVFCDADTNTADTADYSDLLTYKPK